MKKESSKKPKLHVKNGDRVKVISGQNKGRIGTISSIEKKTSKVIITGINIKMKHMKPKQKGESGQLKELEFPIHSSNLLKYED